MQRFFEDHVNSIYKEEILSQSKNAMKVITVYLHSCRIGPCPYRHGPYRRGPCGRDPRASSDP
jgi:hypothetical protein